MVYFGHVYNPNRKALKHRIATQGRNKQELHIIVLIKREQHKIETY